MATRAGDTNSLQVIKKEVISIRIEDRADKLHLDKERHVTSF